MVFCLPFGGLDCLFTLLLFGERVGAFKDREFD